MPILSDSGTAESIRLWCDLGVWAYRGQRYLISGRSFLRAPSVGLCIMDISSVIFYVPDLVSIPYRHAALKHIVHNIGDGLTLTKSLVHMTA